MTPNAWLSEKDLGMIPSVWQVLLLGA